MILMVTLMMMMIASRVVGLPPSLFHFTPSTNKTNSTGRPHPISPIRQLDDNEGDIMKDDKKSDLLFGFRF